MGLPQIFYFSKTETFQTQPDNKCIPEVFKEDLLFILFILVEVTVICFVLLVQRTAEYYIS